MAVELFLIGVSYTTWRARYSTWRTHEIIHVQHTISKQKLWLGNNAVKLSWTLSLLLLFCLLNEAFFIHLIKQKPRNLNAVTGEQ